MFSLTEVPLSLADDIYAIRKEKLQKIEALGQRAYPYKYSYTHLVPEILEKFN